MARRPSLSRSTSLLVPSSRSCREGEGGFLLRDGFCGWDCLGGDTRARGLELEGPGDCTVEVVIGPAALLDTVTFAVALVEPPQLLVAVTVVVVSPVVVWVAVVVADSSYVKIKT